MATPTTPIVFTLPHISTTSTMAQVGSLGKMFFELLCKFIEFTTVPYCPQYMDIVIVLQSGVADSTSSYWNTVRYYATIWLKYQFVI